MEEVVTEEVQVEEEEEVNETADFLREKFTNFVKMLLQEWGEKWLTFQREVLKSEVSEAERRDKFKELVNRTMKALTKKVTPDVEFMAMVNRIMGGLGKLHFAMENSAEKEATIKHLKMSLTNVIDKFAMLVAFTMLPHLEKEGYKAEHIPKIAGFAKDLVFTMQPELTLKIAQYSNCFAEVFFSAAEAEKPEQNS